MNKLKERWGIKSNYQLVIIFIVFAINGSLSAKISAYFMQFLGLTKENLHWSIYYFLLFILVLPLYPFMLMFFGWLFGQSIFFFPFSKKMLKSIGLGFIFKEN
ncbi:MULTISPECIES: DUF6787 family protein [Flavobacterium]|uniref:Diacylglyceryl transferase n=2 Tax=Flavobacterium TaxID=237 RepID=A0AA94JMV1_9FLAO|nr:MULTISPECIES: DUF6787 family protein [Flavobacterium]OXA83133.1 diacylglyceryl transferase [Flavobacterium columnare] [Flavobacterium columnare NBRC 100251 = ATCC 23463]AMA48920.1 diacylglyceryl transferase [Flavobacterium covae]AND64948.1 diacylglyceryl transferase [Flavobacterium covae]MCH4830888.1 diacylglyceryl transferase [Flavobacterium columnare]MCH4833172.1 diacylglyceryl transferase [Flavobacterium columnare]